MKINTPSSSLEQYEQVFDSTQELISIVDTNYRYKVVNNAYTLHYGISKEQIQGCYLYDVMDKDSFTMVQKNLQKTFKGEKISFERWFALPTVQRKQYLLVSYVPYKENDQIVGAIVFIRDYTREKLHKMELEKRSDLLLQKIKMAQVGESLSYISHQWGQQLNILASYIIKMQTQRKNCDMCSQMMGQDLDRCELVLDTLSETIDKFLQFYKHDDEKRVFLINESIKLVLQIFDIRFQSIKANIIYNDTENFKAYGSPNHLSQIIFVLLQNTLEAFSLKDINNPTIEISTSIKNGHPTISLLDNGGGIDTAKLDTIFEKDKKEQSDGLGLGLYVAKLIVEKTFDGTIHLSNWDKGVKVQISLSPLP